MLSRFSIFLIAAKACGFSLLLLRELAVPIVVFVETLKRRADRSPMLFRIKINSVCLTVVITNVITGFHPPDVRGLIIYPILVEMMTARAGKIFVDAVTQIPFVGEAVGRQEMAVDRLIHHLITAYWLAIK